MIFYANKYDQSLLPKFLGVTSRYISAAELVKCEAVDDAKLFMLFMYASVARLSSPH